MGLILFGSIKQRDEVITESKGSSFYETGSKDLWPNGEVPYSINSSLSPALREEIRKAIFRFHFETRIRFVQMKKLYVCPKDYIEFIPGAETESWVGRKGGGQEVFLAAHADYGTIMHELMHVLGFVHEHQRRDRTVLVLGKEDRDTEILSGLNYLTEYDYFSILHYSYKCFDPESLPSKDVAALMGQRVGFSPLDLRAIAKLYNLPLQCTYQQGKDNQPVRQMFFKCEDCWGVESAYGACFACYADCHKGHKGKLLEYRQLSEGYVAMCDCGKANHNNNVCMAVLADGEYDRQSLFICSECYPAATEGIDQARHAVCVQCEKNCHKDHKGKRFYTSSGKCSCDDRCKIQLI